MGERFKTYAAGVLLCVAIFAAQALPQVLFHGVEGVPSMDDPAYWLEIV